MEHPMDLWITQKIYGKQTEKTKVSREELDAYQFSKIIENLRFVKENSRFYKEKYKDIPWQQITKQSDFAKLPFTTAKELADHGMKMICVPQDEIQRIVTLGTSGTTGTSKRVFFTREDQELTIDFFHHGMQYLINEKDRFIILLPCKTPASVGDLLFQGIQRIGNECIPYGLIDDYEIVARKIKEESITSLVGNPVQILTLAEISKKEGLDLKLSSVLLSTDYVPYAICARLKELWGCEVFEHYGMTETGLGGGVFCSKLQGYHMREADLYFEVVDPAGKTVQDGEYGELVFTTLTRQAMPLLRYKTGDYGRWSSERCSCGSDLKLMEKVTHRINHAQEGGVENLYITQLDEILFGIEGVIDYQVVLSEAHLSFTMMGLMPDGEQTMHIAEEKIKQMHIQKYDFDVKYKCITPEPQTTLRKRKIQII